MLGSGSKSEIIQLIFGIIVIMIMNFLFFKFIYEGIRISRLTPDELKFDSLKLIYKKLKKNELISPKLLLKYGKNLKHRTLLLELLDKFNKIELFPKEFSKLEKIAESHLANWLDLNSDYDNLPDKIFFIQNYKLENNLSVLKFKFKNFEPHIMAKKSWMFGYVVYNNFNNKLNQKPNLIFSDFNNKELSGQEIIKLISKHSLNN